MPSPAAELLVGASSADITPPEPTALDGQFELRISQKVDTPLTANVLVLDSRENGRSHDVAVMVSCDLIIISDPLASAVREGVRRRLPELDLQKIVLNATHTHTAPLTLQNVYDIPKTGVMQVDDYCRFAGARIAEAIEKAWKGRAPASLTWGLGHAVVAQNRRAVFADGHAEVAGNTDRPDFRGLEAGEDHDLGALFFWNETGTLVAIVVNVPCPAQEVEGLSSINADFWHPTRKAFQKRYGADVCVLGWAGDQSPHLTHHKAAEERMRELRKISRLEEIARRIVGGVDEAYEVVKDDRHADVPLVHKVEKIRLPMRLVTKEEYDDAQRVLTTERPTQYRKSWYQRVVDRFEKQKTDPKPTYEATIHALRIGDAAVCATQFEVFTDYGVEVKARSRAVQTFLIQLAGEPTYVPTGRAVAAGGYSAIVQSNRIALEGGQILVERFVELINSMWPKE
jgi:hypothetical protein